MAIMHPRVAHNYLKDGYYPTDNATLTGISYLLTVPSGNIRAIDPCCGEGAALQFLRNRYVNPMVCYGVELDKERAATANVQLNHVLNANTFDCVIASNSMSFLFLNPPYGDVVTDHLGTADKGMNRLEVQFTRRCLGMLRKEGVIALVIPFPSLTPAFCSYLVRNIGDIAVYSAATDRFKQVVIMGVRRDMSGESNRLKRDEHKTRLVSVGSGAMIAPPLPNSPAELGYTAPVVPPSAFRFEVVTPDKILLADVFSEHKGLWHRFNSVFSQAGHHAVPNPLRKLSPWHLSLALAAGQISGHVVSNDGSRQLLVKGGTKKVQRTTTTMDEHNTITTKIDQFIPTIRAIDITAGETFGDIIVIQ
ncbi:hypothetical protein TUM4438_10230 [Shewanella sairae]|uniref:DUF6094 domain-containing protein n=1 Tax=Shewanella sairae TaxID=190310 RepID=A0ABQ4P5S2_9GAMM|nr:DUF6094 domain-containing protein [Shewanella sairae]MCL1130457.1 DUF6094 domain-containing protein [Shewanella sairae]GIU42809.1 hypothetical protein TUM4438_10230 [Shewanella sairae]